MDIGRRIREIREDRGMPRSVLARRVGAAGNTLYLIERGDRTPSLGLLERIARELYTEPAELLKEPAPLPEAPPGSGPADAKGPDPDIWGEDEDRPKPTLPGTAGHHNQRTIRENLVDEVAQVESTRTPFLDLFRKVKAEELSPEEATEEAESWVRAEENRGA